MKQLLLIHQYRLMNMEQKVEMLGVGSFAPTAAPATNGKASKKTAEKVVTEAVANKEEDIMQGLVFDQENN